MLGKLAAVVLSALLLSPGWLGVSGFSLFVGLVPLLWISASYAPSRRGWWAVFGWATLSFALWNAATIWWIWYATPVGPFAATFSSTLLNMFAFMIFHTISKKGHKALAYTALVAGWIATEYWYTVSEFSWPWLILGNGFSHDVWAVQWYEFTGVFGGSLWVLVGNILIFEALRARSLRRGMWAAFLIAIPIGVSLGLWVGWKQPDQGAVEVSVVQPNVDCYDKFNGDRGRQEQNLIGLLEQVPPSSEYIIMPETAVPGYYWEPSLSESRGGVRGQIWDELRDSLRADHPNSMLITGGNTLFYYKPGTQPRTARVDALEGGYFDIFNTTIGIDSAGRTQLHHKGRLVIGVENTPTVIFNLMKFLVIDLGGTLGQIGMGEGGTAFLHNGTQVGAAICYEGLYGDFFGDFVRKGAKAMFIISNDGWWGDTPGYKHLFTISRLRAIEHRRAIARSANTGRSGFISARGDIGQTLEWEQRGVLTDSVPLNSKITFYTRYGDYIGRLAQYLLLLCVLYYTAYRFKKRNHLVK